MLTHYQMAIFAYPEFAYDLHLVVTGGIYQCYTLTASVDKATCKLVISIIVKEFTVTDLKPSLQFMLACASVWCSCEIKLPVEKKTKTADLSTELLSLILQTYYK